tara:strand:- start:3292 stop:4272 length:981 start_codon:yes stop_codon:yes gene_type:complete
MNNTIKFLIEESNNGERVDIFLSNKINDLTRSFLKKLIKKNFLKINDKIVSSPSVKLKTNDNLEIKLIYEEKKNLIPKKIKLDIIFEDKDILIVNKQKGLVVHPGAGNSSNTLANALAFKYKNNLSNINGRLRPGIIHRIDKETSGLLVVAKNNLSHSKISKQFSEHTIKRKYKCLVWGILRPLNGKIDTFISRNKRNRQLMSVSEISGKRAITNYKTIKTFYSEDIPKISLMECELETGRTHQIRVHLSYKGVSILGDKQYGKKKLKFKRIKKELSYLLDNLKGQLLHAETIEFTHPTKSKWVKFKSELPKDFKKVLSFLENVNG